MAKLRAKCSDLRVWGRKGRGRGEGVSGAAKVDAAKVNIDAAIAIAAAAAAGSRRTCFLSPIEAEGGLDRVLIRGPEPGCRGCRAPGSTAP